MRPLARPLAHQPWLRVQRLAEQATALSLFGAPPEALKIPQANRAVQA
ncbi:hypothetical protein Syncc8109_1546 [Synechococcus sp. WH 8109]|nr:hypothetical protein Syncc8109_1546 [Synechococcus sp. WH 8109]